ncbi:MAG: hypothetical protein IT381_12980 [Deltaproteobacteria bacterium]|nr:hypothetical protein [Deltaproteobacteria bacterium]
MTNDELLALEQRVNELKKLYDNYFAGLERLEPLKKREALMRELRVLTQEGSQPNTQLQFRFNNLRSRWATLEAHWTRLVKQLEEGKLKRPTLRTSATAAVANAAVPNAAVPNAAVAAAPVAAAPAPSPAVNEDTSMRALYSKYAASRAQSGEAPVSYESMVASLKKQVPAVIERFKCKSVDFRVAQKDGKTIIKAVPIS